MPFCTSCGATVNGAFCPNCGTPISASAASGSAPPPAAQPAAPVYAAPQPGMNYPPVKRKTSPLVWILVVLLGLFVLGGIVTVVGGMFLFHKARQAGLDPDLIQRNPGLAVTKMIAAANPDVDVLKTDDGAGTITLRDKKTGKIMTMSFDEAKKGKITFTEEGDGNKTATLNFGTSTGKLPSWVPSYPGGKVQGTFSVTGTSEDGEGGTFAVTTHDSAAKVLSFYQDALKAQGMTIALNTTAPDGGMVVAQDDAKKQSVTVVVGSGSDGTTVNVTFGTRK